jgi:hypothetical protein
MPHYADGTEAKVGDQVTGTLANSKGIRAGTIVSITPGVESCNAKVRFTEVGSAGAAVDMMPIKPQMAIGNPELAYSQNHGSAGPLQTVWTCEDYCDTNKLTKIGGN